MKYGDVFDIIEYSRHLNFYQASWSLRLVRDGFVVYPAHWAKDEGVKFLESDHILRKVHDEEKEYEFVIIHYDGTMRTEFVPMPTKDAE